MIDAGTIYQHTRMATFISQAAQDNSGIYINKMFATIPENYKGEAVYLILNKFNGKLYIGTTINLHERILKHKRLIRNGKTENKNITADVIKYGETAFDYFLISKDIDRGSLRSIENVWISNLKPQYNICQKSSRHNCVSRHISPTKRICKVCLIEKNIDQFTHHYKEGIKYFEKKCKNCRNKTRRIPRQNLFVLQEGESLLPINELSGKYEISSYGRVCSLYYGGRYGSKKKDFPTVIKTPLNGSGYPSFVAKVNGKHTPFRVHRLVAKYFLTNPLNLNTVLHKDDNKENCRYDNLEWGTQLKNIRDAFANGLHKKR